MNMRMVVSAFASISLALAFGAVASEETSPEELFETKCSVCHPTSRPLSKNKDRAGWEQTVKRMQSKRAGHLSDSDVEAIVNYLTETRGK